MRKFFLIICFSLFCFGVFAQPNEVKLVVTGEGTTKEEATNNALRSAVEQAFGVFVSSNTEILNDDIVKDEIATISSGNIKSYEELAYFDQEVGNKSITLEVVVSIGKLIAYSKSHGSKAEFSGASFGANLKLLQVNKDNAAYAYDHLLKQLEGASSRLYDYTLNVSDPKASGDVTFTIDVTANRNTANIGKMVYNTLLAISLDESQAAPILEMGEKLYAYNVFYCSPVFIETIRGKACLPWDLGTVRYFYNKLDERINEYLCPNPSIPMHDDQGSEYAISSTLTGDMEFVNSKVNIVGIKQGVTEDMLVVDNRLYSRVEYFGQSVVLTFKNVGVGDPLYKIVNTINIPLSHLTKVSAFYLDAPSAVPSDENSVNKPRGNYRIGQYVKEFGGGIVFWVAEDERKVKLISVLEGRNLTWDRSIDWCKKYGDGGWKAPSIEDLTELAACAREINAYISQSKNNGEYDFPLLFLNTDDRCYWSEKENGSYAYRVHLKDGMVYKEGTDERKDSQKNWIRAVRELTIDQNGELKDNRQQPEKAEKPIYHRVKKGETLSYIANKYATSVSAICELNGISSRGILNPGQKLRVR